MSNEKQETVKDIVREMRNLWRLDEKSTDKIPRSLQALGLRTYADRIKTAYKRMVDSIHRAMVLTVGVEMEDSENPPRLWTALEEIYDALSDAIGTDGETTADIEESKAIGRHFVIKSYGNAAKMREALGEIKSVIEKCINLLRYIPDGCEYDEILDEVADNLYDLQKTHVKPALSAPQRNCDVGTADEHLVRHRKWCWEHDCKHTDSCKLCVARWEQMPYDEGGEK